ncbi:hypothetical protein JG687_00017388 [Phytophthora cactorum]|uniref:Uncharacterized protein n=1 Tax=Phytophthora cactorum TaxID=29920 RepID=A0A8T1TRH3_9STRA|nr:hypothetical protein JG687_00017388 [Phytophthora cactorum]
MIIDSNPISESTRSRSSKTPLRAQVVSTNSAMRLTFFLILLVATFVAIDIDFTINSADNAALANNIASEPYTRHPEKGSHKASKEGGEGRTGIAAGIPTHVAARHGRFNKLQSADAMADVVTHDPITRKELVAKRLFRAQRFFLNHRRAFKRSPCLLKRRSQRPPSLRTVAVSSCPLNANPASPIINNKDSLP